MNKFNFTTEKNAAYMAIVVLATGTTVVKYFADWSSFAYYHKVYRNSKIKGYRKDEKGWAELEVIYF